MKNYIMYYYTVIMLKLTYFLSKEIKIIRRIKKYEKRE